MDQTNKLEIPNKVVGEFKFWIYFENFQLKQIFYSPEVTVNVKMRCESDSFFINPEPPVNFSYF